MKYHMETCNITQYEEIYFVSRAGDLLSGEGLLVFLLLINIVILSVYDFVS